MSRNLIIYLVFSISLCYAMPWGSIILGSGLLKSDNVSKYRVEWGTSAGLPIASVVRERPSFALDTALESIIKREEFHRSRILTVNSIIDPKTLLAPGETLPPRHEIYAFVDRRVADFFVTECNTIREIFATDCRIKEYQLEVGEDNLAKLKLKILYRPSDELGPLYKEGSYVFGDTKRNVATIRKPVSIKFDNQERIRQKMYKNFKTQCDRMRREVGTCALGEIAIGVGKKYDAKRVGIYGWANMARFISQKY